MRQRPIPVVPRALRYAGVVAVALAIAYFSLVDTPTPPQRPAAGP